MVIFSLISPPPCNGRFWYQYDYEDRELNWKIFVKFLLAWMVLVFAYRMGTKVINKFFLALFSSKYLYVLINLYTWNVSLEGAHQAMLIAFSWFYAHGALMAHLGITWDAQLLSSGFLHESQMLYPHVLYLLL